MQLLEFVLIGQNEAVIQSLLPDLPLQNLQVSGHNVLRGAISDETAVILYPILFNDTPSDAFIGKITRHASGILISSSITEGEAWLEQHEFWRNYLTAEPVQPVIWVVPLAEPQQTIVEKVSQLSGGLLLGDKSRMFFVPGGETGIRHKIWRTLLMELLPVTISDE